MPLSQTFLQLLVESINVLPNAAKLALNPLLKNPQNPSIAQEDAAFVNSAMAVPLDKFLDVIVGVLLVNKLVSKIARMEELFAPRVPVLVLLKG